MIVMDPTVVAKSRLEMTRCRAGRVALRKRIWRPKKRPNGAIGARCGIVIGAVRTACTVMRPAKY